MFKVLESREEFIKMDYLKIDGHCFYNMMASASNALCEQKDIVNSLNVFPVPDGDTGSNMSMTLKAAVLEISEMKDESLGRMAKRLAKGALMGARGNSGVILSQILRGIAKGLEGKNEVDSTEFAQSISEGARFAYKAVMRPTEGTILTIIGAAGKCALKSNESNITMLLEEVCKRCSEVLDRTPEMLPVLKKANVVDSGGKGLLVILEGMYAALRDGVSDVELEKFESSNVESAVKNINDDDIKYGYCTEFLIHSDADSDAFKARLSGIGDSMVVVSDDGIIKVHIHTNDPGWVLSQAVKLGELSRIKIDNMREEHRHVLGIDGHTQKNQEKYDDEQKEIKKYGFVCITIGEGLKNIFKDLGADYIVEGGQTMNPSTQDILEAVQKVNAENIFVLPNNKNIFMAAKQVCELSDKNVIIVPAKTMPQGITAITSFNSDLDVEANTKSMEESIKQVDTGFVTYAVRDTDMDGKLIKKGDIIGIVEGKIIESGSDMFEVCTKIIDKMSDEDKDLVSIYYGSECDTERVDEFVSGIEEKYSDMDVQSYNGGQPLYYFIVSVE